LQQILYEIATRDFTQYDYVCIFILSHGIESSKLYGIDGQLICMNQIFHIFKPANVHSLINKPKLFFIQGKQ
jgi:hypothetical protein